MRWIVWLTSSFKSDVYCICWCLVFLRNKDTTFSRPVSILMISMILSMFSCLLFHGQSLFNSLLGYVTYGAIVIYFVLFKIRLSPNVVERLIFWMFIIFVFAIFTKLLSSLNLYLYYREIILMKDWIFYCDVFVCLE